MADTAKYSSQTSLLTRLSMMNPDERQIADAIAMASKWFDVYGQ